MDQRAADGIPEVRGDVPEGRFRYAHALLLTPPSTGSIRLAAPFQEPLLLEATTGATVIYYRDSVFGLRRHLLQSF